MNHKQISLLLAGCSVVALLTVAPSAAWADGARNDRIEEVVITAQKKTENLQKASIAVDALSPTQLSNQGIKSIVDLEVLLPTVKFQSGAQTTVNIRGVGTQDNIPGVDSSVAYSLDGIYMANEEALPPVVYDLTRVEAVLGPQGTLYGRNTNGGVLNFITNDPTNHYEGSAAVTFGNYGTVGTEGMINVPLTDTVAARLAFGTQRHNPYHSDGYDDQDDTSARFKLAYMPSDDLKILLAVDGSTQQGHNFFDSYCPPNSAQRGCAGVKFQPWQGENGPYSPAPYRRTYEFGTSLHIDYDLGWANLTSLTGYRTYRASSNVTAPTYSAVPNPAGGLMPNAWGGNFGVLNAVNDRFITQEIRLASEPSSTVSWVAGIYYSDETQPAEFDYNFSFIAPGLSLNNNLNRVDFTSKAVFADVTYPLFDGLRLRGGLRYTQEDKASFGISQIVSPVVTVLAGSTPIGSSESLGRVTWKGGLDYDITSRNLLYFTASNGFKSGGVNALPVSTGLPTTYGPETIVAEEIGSKNRFLNGRLQIDADAYHYDYTGFQSFGFVGAFPHLYYATFNSQNATFWGGELEAKARVTDNDTLSLTADLTHDRFGTFVIPTARQDYTGNWVPNSPKFSYTMSYEHVFMLPNNDELSFQANSEVVAGHYVDFSNDPGSYQNTYHRTGVNISYQTAQSGWTVSAFIRNIENAGVLNVYLVPAPNDLSLNGPMARDQADVDPPRTFGLTIKKVF